MGKILTMAKVVSGEQIMLCKTSGRIMRKKYCGSLRFKLKPTFIANMAQQACLLFLAHFFYRLTTAMITLYNLSKEVHVSLEY